MSLYNKAPNRRLLKLIEDGLNEEERFLRFNLEAMGLGKLSQEDHRALLRAAEERDVERSVKLLEHHLNRGVEAITRYLASPEAQSKKTSR
jgi:DNA-binding GntR family transcriptional regulator